MRAGEKGALFNVWVSKRAVPRETDVFFGGARARSSNAREESGAGRPRQYPATILMVPGSPEDPERGRSMDDREPWAEIDVEGARRRIKDEIVRTPLVRAPEVPGIGPGPVYLKLENLQRTGAFKIRGALNKIASLAPEDRARGVVAASAGNHAQGVAWAARRFGIPATIVMATHASPLKVSATRALGAEVVLFGSDYDDAYDRAVELAKEGGRTLVHPYDDPQVIAGQATIGEEIREDLPDVARIVAGVGGGGLLSGIASAVRRAGSSAEIIGVQPTGASNLAPSLEAGRVIIGPRPNTFADGLATRHIGDLPFRILRAARARAIAVDDRAIARASFVLLEKAKILAEGAGAAGWAAVLDHPELTQDGPVVVVISGGNLDPFVLDRVLFIGLAAEGRLLRLSSPVSDVPGQLAAFLAAAAEAQANVRHIRHAREAPDRSPGEVTVELDLEVRDPSHANEVLGLYRKKGWNVREIPLDSSSGP